MDTTVTTFGPDGKQIGRVDVSLPPATAALVTAQQAVADLHQQVPSLHDQLAADIAAVTGTGWDGLAADQRTAIVLRILNGFGTAMAGLVDHAIVTGAIPAV